MKKSEPALGDPITIMVEGDVGRCYVSSRLSGGVGKGPSARVVSGVGLPTLPDMPIGATLTV